MLGGGPQRRIRRHLTHQRGRTGARRLGGCPISALLQVARGRWMVAALVKTGRDCCGQAFRLVPSVPSFRIEPSNK